MKSAVCFNNCAECQAQKIDGSCSASFPYTREEATAMIKENCNISFIDADIAGEVIEQYCQNVLGITVAAVQTLTEIDNIKANSNIFTIFCANSDCFTIKLPAVRIGESVQH